MLELEWGHLWVLGSDLPSFQAPVPPSLPGASGFRFGSVSPAFPLPARSGSQARLLLTQEAVKPALLPIPTLLGPEQQEVPAAPGVRGPVGAVGRAGPGWAVRPHGHGRGAATGQPYRLLPR